MVAHTTALTRREWEVLELIARGHQFTQVADVLVVSPFTVQTHARHIRQKLGAVNCANAVFLAFVAQDSSCGA